MVAAAAVVVGKQHPVDGRGFVVFMVNLEVGFGDWEDGVEQVLGS